MKYLAVTGFFATGSSAVLDILNGDKFFQLCPEYTYEHVILYNPSSIFDLEWKLIYNNDLHRSNEAIKNFLKEMNRLKKNFGWFGSYKKLFQERFDNIVNEYINSLIDYKHELISYNDYKTVKFSFFKMLLQIAAKILKRRKIYSYGRKYVFYKNSKIQYSAHPTKEKFYDLSKKFIYNYVNLFSNNSDKIAVFDHFVLPDHLNRIDNYFNKDFGFIAVFRDPRDLFILSKYIYEAKNPFPSDVNDFCKFYKNRMAIVDNNDSVLKINFEDLVYNEEKTKELIFNFCGVEKISYESHFFANQSINNTQVFLLSKKWEDEVKIIESELKDYLYDYPYERIPDKKLIFE